MIHFNRKKKLAGLDNYIQLKIDMRARRPGKFEKKHLLNTLRRAHRLLNYSSFSLTRSKLHLRPRYKRAAHACFNFSIKLDRVSQKLGGKIEFSLSLYNPTNVAQKTMYIYIYTYTRTISLLSTLSPPKIALDDEVLLHYDFLISAVRCSLSLSLLLLIVVRSFITRLRRYCAQE